MPGITVGKNAQEKQASAEHIDHPQKVFTKGYGIAVYLLQADKLTTRSETPPGGGQPERFVHRRKQNAGMSAKNKLNRGQYCRNDII